MSNDNQSFENQNIEQQDQQPTRVEKSKKMAKKMFNDVSNTISLWNTNTRYFVVEAIVFITSFIFLVFDNKVDDISGNSIPEMEANSDSLAHKSWLFYFNGFLFMDFFLRLLRIDNDMLDNFKWERTFSIGFPLAMWLLTGYYTFDDVFEKEATGTLNIILFILMNLGVIFQIVMRYISTDSEKNKENDLENNQ